MRTDETIDGPLFAPSPGSADPLATSELGATRASIGPPQAQSLALERGDLVGRYVVLDRIGAGAMGIVYAAFDPELDRKVALKLLQTTNAAPEAQTSQASVTASARLLREAQALARLAHPNVVAVHDVGTHRDQVWIAMEFVEGQTLGRWMRARRRRWPEVVEVLRSAGRGLAAAHAAGLIHRDFKPDNVMVGNDGRVRVMDFGLARRGGAAPPSEVALAAQAMLAVDFTAAGTLLGTPAYMAPEQFKGLEIGPKVDQFALCVTLWEALHGERPFAGSTMTTLTANVSAGTIKAPPGGTGVPGWLRRVLARGLAVDPEGRWPSVDALLTALDRAQSRHRLHAGGLVLAGIAALGLGGVLWQRAELAARVAHCESLTAGIDTLWSDTTHTRLDEALRSAHVPFAASTADRVMPWLDTWAQGWRTVRTATCQHSEVVRDWGPDLRTRADECLDERLQAFSALLAELSTGDTEIVINAVPAASNLTAATACGDARDLARRPALPAGDLDEVRTIRAMLARAGALQGAGKLAASMLISMAALTRAETFAWAPLTAEARLHVGRLQRERGNFRQSAELLEAAYFAAAMASAGETATDAAISLAYVVGERLARPEDGRRWARLAEVGLTTLEIPRESMRYVAYLDVLGHLAVDAGEPAEARQQYQQALTLLESLVGVDHPQYATILNNLAMTEGTLGDHDRERQLFERSIAIQQVTLGPDHPKIAFALNNLGTALAGAGLLEQAKQHYTRALTIRERTLGPDHSEVAETLTNLASTQFLLGELDQVEPLFTRALAIKEKALGPDHPGLAETLNNFGYVANKLGRFAEATTLLRRALTINQKERSDKHPAVAMNLRNLGLAELHGGKLATARSLLARALAGSSAAQLAELRFGLAQALWLADRTAARELAEQAREGYAGVATKAQQLAEVDAWLSAHRP
jgi:tetratricopeptide (TPR) repeat protein/predicted Ser/Thr protein kinase